MPSYSTLEMKYIGLRLEIKETKSDTFWSQLCEQLQNWCIPSVTGVFLVCVCGARPAGASRTTGSSKAQSPESRQCIFVCEPFKDLLLFVGWYKALPAFWIHVCTFSVSGQAVCNHNCRHIYCALWIKADLYISYSNKLHKILHRRSAGTAQTEVKEQIWAALASSAH